MTQNYWSPQNPRTTQNNTRSRNIPHTRNSKQKYITYRNVTHITNQNTHRHPHTHNNLRQQYYHSPEPIPYNLTDSSCKQNYKQHFLAPDQIHQDTGWNLVIRKNRR
uniref:Uncharacterized protein n=1 Tax=Octopus bimaculoides TaxID=37653 RepID=A0A0L8GNM4_OCTBM